MLAIAKPTKIKSSVCILLKPESLWVLSYPTGSQLRVSTQFMSRAIAFPTHPTRVVIALVIQTTIKFSNRKFQTNAFQNNSIACLVNDRFPGVC